SAEALYWLPRHADPDREIAALRGVEDPSERFRAIERLAHTSLDFLQTGKLDRLLAKTVAELPSKALPPKIKLAWLSSCTAQHLVPGLRVAALRRGLLVDVWMAPYGLIEQPLMDDASELLPFKPDVIFIHFAPDAALPLAPIDLSTAEADAAVARRVE